MTTKQRNVIIERGVRISGGASSSAAGGDFAKQAVEVIRGLNDKRENEKQELQVLNQRFSSYVERVRALEAMNRKLLADIEELKSKWGFDSGKIKDMMEPELLRYREQIDEITRQKAIAEIKSKRAETDAQQFRHMMDLALESYNADKIKIQNLERLLENTSSDCEYLKSQFGDINDQIARYLEEQRTYYESLRQYKDKLDLETIERVARQNEVQTLEEQIAFIKAVHEQEVSELSRLQTIVGFDPAQFYRNELERAIRDIRGDFEQLNHEQKRELEEWYKIKTEEVEREVQEERERVRLSTTGCTVEQATNLRQSANDSAREYVELQTRHIELSARLRELEEHYEHQRSENSMASAERDREISILREKISELMSTYDELLGRKTSLEFEINTYRRLLECEETRIQTSEGVTSGNVGSSSFYKYQSRASETAGSSSAIASNLINAASSRGARGSSVEQTTETVMKRMQVQRTSKGMSCFVFF
jgi:chromosome segregation ATPase